MKDYINVHAQKKSYYYAETKDFARLTSYPMRGWTRKNKAFCSLGTQNGRCVIKATFDISIF